MLVNIIILVLFSTCNCNEYLHKWTKPEWASRHWDPLSVAALSNLDIKLLFPQLISKLRANSSECSKHIALMINEAKAMNSSWALKMVDAFGKPPSGVFQGDTFAVGNYDECLSTRAPGLNDSDLFQGKFCTGIILPPPNKKFNHNDINSSDSSLLVSMLVKAMNESGFYALPRMDVCMPSTCTPNEIMYWLDTMIYKYNLVYYIPDHACSIEQSEPIMTGGDIVILVITIVVVIVLGSSVYDGVTSNSISDSNVDTLDRIQYEKKRSILTSFSLLRNIKSLLDSEKKDGTIH